LLLVVLLDVSGSMSGTRLALAKSAFSLLLDKLRQGDSLALVTFNNSAEVRLPLTAKDELNK
jgi:Ca-activated chloride channel family protein